MEKWVHHNYKKLCGSGNVWGYVVAIPEMPDEIEPKIAEVLKIFGDVQELTNQSGSIFHKKIDPDSLAVVSYSVGGSTALAAA